MLLFAFTHSSVSVHYSVAPAYWCSHTVAVIYGALMFLLLCFELYGQ